MKTSNAPNHAASGTDCDIRARSLAGAFAEGADLGPRGPQIRELGRSIDILVQALRQELARGRLSERLPVLEAKLATVARAARIAQSYDANEDDPIHGPESADRDPRDQF